MIAEFHIEWFALDLIMDGDGLCAAALIALIDMDDGSIHRCIGVFARNTMLATGGYGRAYFLSDLERTYQYR